MNQKQKLGQFFTTNYEYILQGFSVPNNIEKIIEPFVGNGDLLKFLPMDREFKILEYDIDPKRPTTIKQDTISYPAPVKIQKCIF